MESLILAICYKNEKNESKLKKIRNKISFIIEKMSKKYTVNAIFSASVSTVFINICSLNSIENYLDFAREIILKSRKINAQTSAIIGTKREIMCIIKDEKLDFGTKKIFVLQGDEQGNEYYVL